MIGIKESIKFITLILIIIFILSCSDKKSPFGYNQEFNIKIDTLYNVVDIVASYSDSIGNTYENNTLAVGNFNFTKTRSIFRFLELPDTTWLDSVNIDSTNVTLYRKGSNGEDLDFELRKITKSWLESTVTWDTLSAYWGDVIPSQFNYEVDTLYFDLPTDLIEYWIVNDTINYGFGVSSTNSDSIFTEFYSSEAGFSPELNIYITGDSGKNDTLVIYPSKDALIAKNFNNDNWNFGFISNLPVRRTVFEVDKDSLVNYLIEEDGLASNDIPKIAINRAELIIDSLLIEDSYISHTFMEFYPFYLNDSENFYDYTGFSGREKSYYDGQGNIEFVISGIMQAQLRDLVDNNRFLLKSDNEDDNYSFIKFNSNNGNIFTALKVIYTISQ